ncbi:MAG: ATP-binding protein [Eubacteriales bacterium]|nr:ATP-binding protein [Eubacteriales bacterium]
MTKSFNVNGLCYPTRHYMVNLQERLAQVKQLVDNGDYFIINRARQYGKTTLLRALRQYLQKEYMVVSLDFQKLSSSDFEDEYRFASIFADAFLEDILTLEEVNDQLSDGIEGLKSIVRNAAKSVGLTELFRGLRKLCSVSPKPLVLMIDEVDSATNNQVFLDFLAQLRAFYLEREDKPTFQSVILAGVYDVKNLKHKIRPEDGHRYNSPWNIAADFNVDMSFSVSDIESMLLEYEQDVKTGMDIQSVASAVYDYTSGYPYLVSRICKLLAEQIVGTEGFENLASVWTKEGVVEAVKEILKESNTLFDDMRKKLFDYPELRNMLYAILFNGNSFPFNPDNYAIDIGVMFGFVKEKNGIVAVTNRIFETRLYNLFMSEEIMNSASYQAGVLDKNQFIQAGELNMDLIMRKFTEHFTEVYADCDARFVEENGRRIFLLYLKPIINGTGNYYIEARTRDMRRTDVIVDYRGKQYVIEMKLWRGNEYNKRGEKQLAGYLDNYKLSKGYLLSFNFNKNKEVGVKTIICDGKTIVEAVV